MPFKDADDAKDYLGGIFDTAFADPKIGPQLAKTGMIFRIGMTDPDATFVVDMAEQTVYRGDDAPEPNASLLMTADMHNAYWQGKLNFVVAMAKKQLKIEGNVGLMLKLAPLSKPLEAAYRDRLIADGRTDLLL
jgi:putative sterol carrier protein